MASNNSPFLLILFVIFAFCLSNNGVYAFGAGNIPSFAYMEGRAFRHGDIEDILSELVKRGAGGGFALASLISKGKKFNGLDVKRVYFGNWLRDYSQAVDIASLKKLQLQTIINLCMALGFLAHGYATHEFEVTEERLGVYLPTEHIDNPKGYGAGEDARQYHPKLRGPVNPQELEVDPRTGMKNYIANEQGPWDTSKALVRRTLEQCIHRGRQNRATGDKADEYEAFRLLGQALHTLEDYSAHSNFCELALVSMGHEQVFVHVGDQVRIQAPNGKRVAPIVTGSFGSSDFIHSLLGEATDHLASVTDLNKELDKARTKSLSQTRGPGGPTLNPADALRELFFTLPGGAGGDMSRDLDNIERIRAGPAAGGKNPDQMSPQELHAVLWQVLTFRDSVVKKISKTIEKIPGLGPLIEKLMDSISVFVFTTLEPFLKPILKTATSGLQTVSGEVIDNHDQYEVFNDPRASDPTHSFLSKDHFNLILNEPAGQIARIIVAHSVKLISAAWDDNSKDVHQITEDILQCLFHPDFHNNNSQIQREMMQCMTNWISKVPNQHSTIQRLSKDSVRNHQNIRLAGEGGAPESQGSFAEGQAHQFQQTLAGYASNVPGVAQAQSIFGSGSGQKRETPGSGFPGAGAGYGQGPPPGGQSTSYYGGGAPPAPGGYGAPSGPPPSSYGGQAPASPSHGPPPSSYGGQAPAPPSHGPPQPQHGGYASSYTPSYGQDTSFPSAGPSFPDGAGGGGGAPSFPGAAPSFPGATPGFPGAEQHHHHGHHEHHHEHHQGHGGPGGYGPGGGGPGFPGGPEGFGAPPEPGAYGFPGADPYQGNSAPPQFPGGSNPYYGGGGPGGW
ncbi:hypothetical protein CVT25_006811 [Psilocybe cyanescens]|uniref:Het-C-domain-containing protein n=1 Tax=Psilocybe cyanescens TaxID=93625 RepID=A0A409X7C7_PSICY|nr:hypothetical protein CVT25_006811 [Psilocybe cyanescens]